MALQKHHNHEILAVSALVCTTWAVLAARMFYYSGSGEHDTFMMAAGIIHGAKISQAINSMTYGSDLQFFFYYFSHYVVRAFEMDGRAVLLAMNLAGTVLALLIPLLLFFFLRSSAGSSVIAILFLVTSPTYAFLVPYGHPFHGAIALSLISFLVFKKFLNVNRNPPRFSLFLTAILLQGLALTIRAEQVGLFWFCVIGLLIYKREKNKGTWIRHLLLFGCSTLIYMAMRYFIVTMAETEVSLADPSETTRSVWGSIIHFCKVLRETYSIAQFPRSIAYHITDIGLPLLSVATFFLIKQFRKKQYRALLGLIFSVGPSFLVYLVNPSPPRHFAITVIGLAIYIGASTTRVESYKLAPIAVLLFAINVLTPPLMGAFDPHSSNSQRRNYTYSFAQRNDRNKEQIATTLPFFSILLESVPTETVIFCRWIHIAQISFLTADSEEKTASAIKIAPSVKARVLSTRGRRIYLVEANNRADVEDVMRSLRKLHPNWRFISVLPSVKVNELDIRIPPKIGWWSV